MTFGKGHLPVRFEEMLGKYFSMNKMCKTVSTSELDIMDRHVILTSDRIWILDQSEVKALRPLVILDELSVAHLLLVFASREPLPFGSVSGERPAVR
jgi:hypothetical protein